MKTPAGAMLMLVSTCLLGCATGGPSGLPGGAALVREGVPPLASQATEAGHLFVRDISADRVIYRVAVSPGQALWLDNTSSQILLNRQPVPNLSLRTDTPYQIFFKPASKREYHPAYNP